MRALAHRRIDRADTDDREGERGAVVAIVALFLAVVVVSTALTVDIGRLSTNRRKLQSVADVVALDLVRQLDGRTAGQITADPRWAAAITASRDRNDFPAGGTRNLGYQLGTYDAVADVFTVAAATDIPSAVRVSVADTVDYEFAPGGQSTERHAVATQEPMGGFSIGSTLASIDSSRSVLLQALLNDALDVDVAGYDGLLGARIDLGDLVQGLGLDLGSPDQALSAQVPVAQILLASVGVLRNQGDVAQAQVLEQVIAQLPASTPPITLGDLISVAPNAGGAAAQAQLDALQLLTATALVANGDHFLTIPNLALAVPGAVSSSLQLKLIEAPRWVFGPLGSSVQTAQLRATVTTRVQTTVLGTLQAELPITVTLSAGNGSGTIDHLSCHDPEELGVSVATSAVQADATVGGTVAATIPLVGTATVANVTVALSGSKGATSGTADFVLPPDAYGDAKQVGSGTLGLNSAQVTSSKITVLPVLGAPAIDSAALLNAILTGAVRPTLDAVDALVRGPLGDVLGLSIATADVTPLSVSCTGPRLAG